MSAVSDQQDSRPMTEQEANAWRNELRELDSTIGSFDRPDDVEPLATRLERAERVADCRDMTGQMLTDWHDDGAPIVVYNGVWTRGICIDFLVLTWKGVFCVWSVDHRWTVDQAAIVEPARSQIQAELAGWRGRVEAAFHSPREGTGWHRHLLVHPISNEPVEIVTMGGRIDEVLQHWEPFEGIGLDPEWLTWLCRAATPRWWRSDEGRIKTPTMPREEQL